MALTNQNFSMYQNTTFNIIIPCTKQDGSNLDLTGATITWALRQRMTSTNNLITKSTSSGITVSGNTMTVNLVPSDTATLKGAFFHECKMTDTQGDVSELFNGTAVITISNL